MEHNKIADFYFGLKSGRQWGFVDYYHLSEYDEENKIVRFVVYDSNMMPHSYFETWSDDAKSEVIQYVRDRFKGFVGSIFIDNQELVFKAKKNV